MSSNDLLNLIDDLAAASEGGMLEVEVEAGAGTNAPSQAFLAQAKAVLRERFIRSGLESIDEEAVLKRIRDDAQEDPVRRQVAGKVLMARG